MTTRSSKYSGFYENNAETADSLSASYSDTYEDGRYISGYKSGNYYGKNENTGQYSEIEDSDFKRRVLESSRKNRKDSSAAQINKASSSESFYGRNAYADGRRGYDTKDSGTSSRRYASKDGDAAGRRRYDTKDGDAGNRRRYAPKDGNTDGRRRYDIKNYDANTRRRYDTNDGDANIRRGHDSGTGQPSSYNEYTRRGGRGSNVHAQGKKSRQKSKFRKYFLISWIIFAAILAIALVVLSISLTNYDKNLPEHTVENIINELNAGSTDSLHFEITDAQGNVKTDYFKDMSGINKYVSKKASETGFTYSVVSTETTDTEKVYNIKSGDDKIFKVYLKQPESGKGWNEYKTNITANDLALSTISVQIPSGNSVLINNIELDDAYITERDADIALLKNLIDQGYLSNMPKLNTYKAEGIFYEPEVLMKDTQGQLTACTLSGETYIAGFEASEEFIASQKDRVISMFEPYAKYFTGDAGVDALNQIMLTPSPAYESATKTDVSWVQEHSDVVISEEKAENFKQYADNCFSCDISFVVTIYVGDTPSKTWDTNMTWIFIKDGELFYLADFVTNAQ